METKQARLEPYFGLWRGHHAKYSELGETAHLVDLFVAEGTAAQQHLLPLENAPDSIVWFPEKVNARRRFEENRIADIRQQLQKAVRI